MSRFVRLSHVAGTDPTRQVHINPEAVAMLLPVTTHDEVRKITRFSTRILFTGGGEVTIYLPLESVIAAMEEAPR